MWLRLKQMTLADRWWKLKGFLWGRHSTVRARYLPHTWVDRCELLPHLMFEVLSNFMEQEDPFADSEDSDWRLDRCRELYWWWHNEYIPAWKDSFWSEMAKYEGPKVLWEEITDGAAKGYLTMKSVYKDDAHKAEYEAALQRTFKFEKEMKEELERNCKRLIEVMGHLWT
jgi:hypothetical protein